MLTCFDTTGQNKSQYSRAGEFLWLVQCYPGRLRSQKNSSSFQSMSKWHHRQLYEAMCQDIMAHFSENILNQYKSLLVTYFIPSKSMGKFRPKNVDPPPSWGRHVYPKSFSSTRRCLQISLSSWSMLPCTAAVLLRSCQAMIDGWMLKCLWSKYIN